MADEDGNPDELAGGAEDEEQHAEGAEEGGDDAAGLVEDEAGEDDDEGEDGEGESVVDSSEEEDEEEGNEYEVDGFVVEEGDEEDGGEGEDEEGGSAKKKKKKKKNKKRRAANQALDDDEYDLLEEAGVRVQRPTGHKRLKRAGEGRGERDAKQMRDELFGGGEELEDQLEDDDDDADEGMGGGGRAPKPKGRRPPGGGPRDRDGRRGDDHRPAEHDALDDLDDDEMGDFIVDEGPGGQGRRRHRFGGGGVAGISEAALQEAAEIFGDVEGLLEMYHGTRIAPGAQAGDEDLEIIPEGDEDDDDEDAIERRQIAREEAERRAVLKKAMRMLDAETLQSQYLMPADQAIREKDLPERFQLLSVVADEREPMDLEECADWIHWLLFVAKPHQGRCMMHVSSLVKEGLVEVDSSMQSPEPEGTWPRDMLITGPDDSNHPQHHRDSYTIKLGSRRAVRKPRPEWEVNSWERSTMEQDKLRRNIKQALSSMYDRGEEPVLQGLYRKEHLGDLSAMRHEDAPLVTTQTELDERQNTMHDAARAQAFDLQTVQPRHRRIRRFDALWAIMWLSLRYRKISRRRAQLLARLDTCVASMRAAGAEKEADHLGQLKEWLGPQCYEAQLDDVDVHLKLAQEMYGVEADLGALNLDPSQGERGKAVVPGRAGGGRGGAANLAAFRKLHSLGVVAIMRKPLITAAEYAENLEDPDAVANTAEEPTGPPCPPEQWFWDQCVDLPLATHGIVNSISLITRIKGLAVHELASEPRVRAWLREYFDTHAVVSTQPTSTGMDHALMEPYAKYGRVKHYKEKPVATFWKTDNFLRVVEATRERLLTFTLELTPKKLDELHAQLKRLYISTNTSMKAQAWNDFRSEIVAEALRTRLLPQAAQEARQRLLVLAKEVALDDFGSAFWRLASASPMRLRLPDEDQQGEDFMLSPRIMAVCWGPGDKQPTVVVALNEQGGLVDLLPCGQLSGRVPRSMRAAGDTAGASVACMTDPRKSKDMTRLLEKVLERKPHALVIGISDPAAATVRADMQSLLDHMLDTHPRFIQELETANIEMLPADERLATLWQDCKAAKDEFPEQPALVRRAIALGRLQLDPLPILAALCGARAEVLSLSLTDMQGCLQEAERLRVVEQLMVTATAQVGVDINLASNVGWHQHLLQFVPGLGPRKAQALLQAVARNANKVESRNYMYKELGDVLGRTVFRNCGGMLRVTSAGLPHLANLELRQLDDSRIHPESYKLAVAMCIKATGEEDVEAAVEEHKDKIELVDLVALAEEKQAATKLPTIIDIQLELLAPFGEVRPPARPPGDKECFLMQHGETDSSLCPGRLVEARVVYIGKEEVKVRLNHCAMDGVILKEDISSNPDWQRSDLRDMLQKDQVLSCRVIAIDDTYKRPGSSATQVVVRLSCKSSDMDPATWERRYCQEMQHEPYYEVPTPEQRRDAMDRADKAARGGTPGRVAPPTPSRTAPGTPSRTAPKSPGREGGAAAEKFFSRPINHPLFKNASAKQAATTLNDPTLPPGACIVRPSNKPSGLNISIKVYQAPGSVTAIIMNLKVMESTEKVKPQNQLSPPLRVDMEHAGIRNSEAKEFEDLDELHAAFVEPLVARVGEVTGHRKFAHGTRAEVEQKARQEFELLPPTGSLPYFLNMHSEHSVAHFGIVFALRSSTQPGGCRIHHEYFQPRPEGFYFRKKLYDNIEKVIHLFKKQPVSQDRMRSGQDLGYALPMHGIPGSMAPLVQARAAYPSSWATGAPQHLPPPPQQQYGAYPQQQQPQSGGYGSYNAGYNAGGGGYSQPGGGYSTGGSQAYGAPSQQQGGYGGYSQPPPAAAAGRARSKWDQGGPGGAGAPAGGAYGAGGPPGPPSGGPPYGGGPPAAYGGGGGAYGGGGGGGGSYGGPPAAPQGGGGGAYGAGGGPPGPPPYSTYGGAPAPALAPYNGGGGLPGPPSGVAYPGPVPGPPSGGYPGPPPGQPAGDESPPLYQS